MSLKLQWRPSARADGTDEARCAGYTLCASDDGWWAVTVVATGEVAADILEQDDEGGKEAAEAACARLLAQDAGVQALLGSRWTHVGERLPAQWDVPNRRPQRVWQIESRYHKEPIHGIGVTAREAVMWALDDCGIEERVMEEAVFGPIRFEARLYSDDNTLGDAEEVVLQAEESPPVVRWASPREAGGQA